MKNIGVLGDYAKTNRLLTCLHSNFNELNIFKITPSSCRRLNAADIVILNKYQKKINLKYISESAAIIINSDSFYKTNPVLLRASGFITTGYSHKSTLTVSSVNLSEINSVLCCLQRSIKTYNGRELKEQEFLIQAKYDDISLLLAAAAAALYLGIDEAKIKNIFKNSSII